MSTQTPDAKTPTNPQLQKPYQARAYRLLADILDAALQLRVRLQPDQQRRAALVLADRSYAYNAIGAVSHVLTADAINALFEAA